MLRFFSSSRRALGLGPRGPEQHWDYLIKFQAGQGGGLSGWGPLISDYGSGDLQSRGVHWGTPKLTDSNSDPLQLQSATQATLIANDHEPFTNEMEPEEGTVVLNVGEILAPCLWPPPAIWCVGHAEEMNLPIPKHPVFFLKAPTAIQRPAGSIRIPKVAQATPEVDYEAELAVIIGSRPCASVSVTDALSYVSGYACANDVTARRWQGPKGGNQWTRSKSFDTFCPLGPMLASKRIVSDPQTLQIETRVNNELVQSSSTSDMIFSVAELISALSQSITLLPGTVILTGTPHGVGLASNTFLKEGDKVSVRIDHLGELTSTVVNE